MFHPSEICWSRLRLVEYDKLADDMLPAPNAKVRPRPTPGTLEIVNTMTGYYLMGALGSMSREWLASYCAIIDDDGLLRPSQTKQVIRERLRTARHTLMKALHVLPRKC